VDNSRGRWFRYKLSTKHRLSFNFKVRVHMLCRVLLFSRFGVARVCVWWCGVVVVTTQCKEGDLVVPLSFCTVRSLLQDHLDKIIPWFSVPFEDLE
jgi:hypothetical protein